jgi:TonB family protein
MRVNRLNRRETQRSRSRVIGPVSVSVLLHILLLLTLAPLWPHLMEVDDSGHAIPVSLLIEVPENPEPLMPTEPELSGQIVDTPAPQVEETPDDSEYLAEHDRTVPEETRTRYRVNPEVLAEQYSEDDQLQFEDLLDLNITEPSTGARVGNDRFDPDRNGVLASLPSPFSVTNRDGMQRPVPSSHAERRLAGAPNNDRLDERMSDRLALNTRELKYAGYLNRIRRLVNFYWSQNLQNLGPSAQALLTRSSYRTVVFVILGGDGTLESVDITRESGVRPLDSAVVDAFRIAGPFANPPSQLVSKDGRVYLPDFDFTVNLGHARSRYRGIDPRQGVRFPGILKVTQ